MFDAISAIVKSKVKGINKMNVKPKDSIFEKIKENPQIRERLLNFSKDFKKLEDPWIFNLVANLATFEKLARFTDVNIDDLLEYLNTGIKTAANENDEKQNKPDWVKNHEFVEIDARKLTGFFLKDILNKEASLPENTGLKVIQNFLLPSLYLILNLKQKDLHHQLLNISKQFHQPYRQPFTIGSSSHF